jgi:hypothetical protein
MEYPSVSKRKELQTHAATRLTREGIVLRDFRQTQGMTLLLQGTQGNHIQGRMEVARAVREREGQLVLNGDRVSVWEDEKCLEMDGWW